MAEDTPWAAGRFDHKRGSKHVLFGRMYEDTAIEAAAFPAGSRVFCIASAGCTAMAMARDHEVTAVDINPVQIEYAQRRAAGGPMQTGSAERLVAFGRTMFVAAGWSKALLQQFLGLQDIAQQVAFWDKHLNTARFRLATDAMLSFSTLGRVYATPFLRDLPAHFGRVMRGRMERTWRTHPNATNPYAPGLLLNDAPAASVPTQASGRIRFVCADAAEYLESLPAGSFDGFTLSNILDGTPDAYRARLFRALRHAGTPDSRMVLRSFGEPATPQDAETAARDRSILWGSVRVQPVATLNDQA